MKDDFAGITCEPENVRLQFTESTRRYGGSERHGGIDFVPARLGGVVQDYDRVAGFEFDFAVLVG